MAATVAVLQQGPRGGAEAPITTPTTMSPFVISQPKGLLVRDQIQPRGSSLVLGASADGDQLILTERTGTGTVRVTSGTIGSTRRSTVLDVLSGVAVPVAPGRVVATVRTKFGIEMRQVNIDGSNVVRSPTLAWETWVTSVDGGTTIVYSENQAYAWPPAGGGLVRLNTPPGRMVTSAASGRMFAVDLNGDSSYVLSRNGEVLREFQGRYDGILVGDWLLLWDVDRGTLERVSLNTWERVPLLVDKYAMLMSHDDGHVLLRTSPDAPGTHDTEQALTYQDCLVETLACDQVGDPIAEHLASEFGTTASWQLRANYEMLNDGGD
ncbi:MAG TPA: hypothetical protein VFK52_08870 [Nocardioidaceae bacterium]|nr:hypothetical protein [Nocardioidaceae bacterium]